MRRGWYFGSDKFREQLLERLGRDDGTLAKRRRTGYSGAQARDHGEREAIRIIAEAETVFGLGAQDWADTRKGDWRKGVTAALIRERALIDNGWLAERLHMGARNAVSRTIRHGTDVVSSNRQARNQVDELRKRVEAF